MVPADSRLSQAPTSRRTVRIVKRRLPPKAALISLFITATAAACAFLAWRLWQVEDDVAPFRRTLPDVLLTYQCTRGDTFQAKGQVEPIRCPDCGREAYPLATYICPTHQDQDVLVRFVVGDDGDPVVGEVRTSHTAAWTKPEDGVRCTKCGAIMTLWNDETIDAARLKHREARKRSAPPRPDAAPPNDSVTPSP